MEERNELYDDPEVVIDDSDFDEMEKLEDDFNPLTSVRPFANPKKEIVPSKLLTSISEKILYTLLRKKKNVIIIEGDLGSGRRTSVEYAQRLLDEKKCPEILKKAIFLEVDMSAWIGGEEDIIKYFSTIIQNYQEKDEDNFVFYLGDFNSIPSEFLSRFFSIKEKIEQLNPKLLKFILIKEKESSRCEYDGNVFSESDSGIGDFELVKDALIIENENELDYSQMIKNLKPTITELEQLHNVVCSDEIAEKALLIIASRDVNQDITYYFAIHTLDSLMSVAEFEGCGERISVTEEHMRKLFCDDYMIFDSLSDFERELLAKHEAGHTILMLWLGETRYSVEGIKIIHDNFSGSGGISYAVEKVHTYQTREFIKEKIAVMLAGRIAEGQISRGAEVDLETANEIAREFVLNVGNIAHMNNLTISEKDVVLTDTVRHTILKEVTILLDDGEFLARTVLTKNEKALNELTKAILKTGILTKGEIFKIWNEYRAK